MHLVMRLIGVSAFIALVITGSGCSSFERDWNALAAAATPESGIEGRWDGAWRSAVNDHTGRLRCIIATDTEGTLLARYRASYGGFLRFEYTVPMDVVEVDGEVYRFSAEADLGWLAGGRYAYEGKVVEDRFVSTYCCARDHGIFEMRRVAEPDQRSE